MTDHLMEHAWWQCVLDEPGRRGRSYAVPLSCWSCAALCSRSLSRQTFHQVLRTVSANMAASAWPAPSSTPWSPRACATAAQFRCQAGVVVPHEVIYRGAPAPPPREPLAGRGDDAVRGHNIERAEQHGSRHGAGTRVSALPLGSTISRLRSFIRFPHRRGKGRQLAQVELACGPDA